MPWPRRKPRKKAKRSPHLSPKRKKATQERQFTLAELQQYDGINGRPAYVAVNSIVYDVTNSPTWVQGMHQGLQAGQDLTTQFQNCHDPSVLATLPKVGILV